MLFLTSCGYVNDTRPAKLILTDGQELDCSKGITLYKHDYLHCLRDRGIIKVNWASLKSYSVLK